MIIKKLNFSQNKYILSVFLTDFQQFTLLVFCSIAAVGFLTANILFISYDVSAAADFVPCRSCALQRLISDSSEPSYDNNDSMKPEQYIDYSVLESIIPSSCPKGLKGLEPEDTFDLLKRSIEETASIPGDSAVASYKVNGAAVVITRLDLEKMMLEMPAYQGNADSVLMAQPEEKLRCLHNIVKTNLLVEEGLSKPELVKKIASEKDYYKSVLYEKALAEALKKYKGNFFPESASQLVNDYETDRMVKNSAIDEIGLVIDTQNVMLVKQLGAVSSSGFDRQKILARYKGGTITFGDIFNSLLRYCEVNNGWDALRSSNTPVFLTNMTYDIIFPEAYSSFLLQSRPLTAQQDKDDRIVAYEEYRTYHLAQMVLNLVQDAVSVSKEECADYFNAKSDEINVREKITITYMLFSTQEVSFFEKASKKSLDELTEQIVGNDIASEIYTNEFFYRGHLPVEIENYLFGLEVGKFSKVLSLSSGKHIIFYVQQKRPASKPEFLKVYPIINIRLLEEKKKKTVEKYFEGLYKKYDVSIKLK